MLTDLPAQLLLLSGTSHKLLMWHFFVKQEDNVKVFRRIYERFAEGKNAFKVAVAAADTQEPDAKKCYL